MQTIKAGEVELCYETFGEGGEPLVLIMGVGAQMVQWDTEFCQRLSQRGFYVIRFDNRDVGKSTHFDHLEVPRLRTQSRRFMLGLRVQTVYTLADMAGDVVALFDALEIESAHVVGASMGGMIAQTIAIHHPHRVRTLTSIMSHPGDRLSMFPRKAARAALLRKPPKSAAEAETAGEAFFRVIGSTGFRHDIEAIRRRSRQQFERGLNPAGMRRQLLAIMAQPDRRRALGRLELPALVVHGSVDPLIRPRGGRQTAAALRDAELMMIEGMGHDLPRAAWPRIIDGIARVARRSRWQAGASAFAP